MCLPDFKRFELISETQDALIGYRNWRVHIQPEDNNLISEVMDYVWVPVEGPHEVKNIDSGLYSYNNYNFINNYKNNNNYYNNNYRNNNNYYNNYYYKNNNNYYNYYIGGIILSYGKVAVHRIGYRSEYAKVKTLFTIRELDAKGPKQFLNWIKEFNIKIILIANKYNSNTINWQDFNEAQKGMQ